MERADLMGLVLSTGRAEVVGEWVVLCDPSWGESECSQWVELRERLVAIKPESGLGWLGVPTGGTSGRLKFARHDERTLCAAVRGFCAHFGVEQVNAVDVLPAHHVSGLMARVRCAETGGRRVAWSWKELEAGGLPELDFGDKAWFISLVPTQLQRLLGRTETVAWLKQFRAILIGGGPIWSDLADTAVSVGLPLAPCYGMSETAAMVAAVLPEAFLQGERSCGRVMPHAQIEIVEELVCVRGDSVCRGYLGDVVARGSDEAWVTEDLGQIDARGWLTIFGRRDAVIISGGKKIHPSEVEAALLATGLFREVAVIGIPDVQWGQVVAVCYSPALLVDDLERAGDVVEKALASYKRPKHWLAFLDEQWPRNEQGKVRRSALVAQAMKMI